MFKLLQLHDDRDYHIISHHIISYQYEMGWLSELEWLKKKEEKNEYTLRYKEA